MDNDRQQSWQDCRTRVGSTIRQLRQDRSMTQQDLAHASSLSRNQLIALEAGRRGVLFERLNDVADALGVPVGDLF